MPQDSTNTEPLLEHLLVNGDDNAKHTHNLLENLLEQGSKGNIIEPLLENSLELQQKQVEKLGEINDSIKSKETVEIKKTDLEDAQTFIVKGKQGEKGDTGPAPSDEHLIELIKPLIPSVKDGVDGKTPTPDEILALLRPLIPVVENGKDGRDGLDGKNAEAPTDEHLLSLIKTLIPKVRDGVDGKDGSPDTAEQIIAKIDGKFSYNSLKDIPHIFKTGGGPGFLREISDVAINNPTNTQVLSYDSATRTWKNTNQASGGGAWGSITGTLSNQTDLQTALNAKQASITTGTTAQYFRGDFSLATFPTNLSSFTNGPGYITGNQTITLTGDISGSGATSIATTIGANKVTIAMMAPIATATFLGRTTTSTGNVEVLTAAQATALLNNLVGDSGSGGTKGLVPAPATGDATKFLRGDGTWASASASGMTNPMTTLGDIIYEDATPTPVRLAGNTTTTRKFLRQTGNGSISAAPAWDTLLAADVPTLNQNTTGSAASFTGALLGDVTGTQGATIVGKINGTSLAGLATGILKNTTTTGVPSIAIAADFPTLNQNTTGSAAKLTTARTLFGSTAFDGTANITDIIASTFGGTGNGFTKFSGPATSEKTFTLPNANATLARTDAGQTFTGTQGFASNITIGTTIDLAGSVSGTSKIAAAASGGGTSTLPAGSDTLVGKATTDVLTNKDLTSGTNTFPTFNQNTTGSAAKLTTARNIAGNSFDGSANVAFANKFIVQGTTDTGLSGAQFLGALGTGILKNTTTTGILSIATGADLPVMTATVGGAVPTPPNNTTTFLRGDGTFATPAGSGDMVLATAQTVTGAKTFNAGKLLDKGEIVFDVKAFGAVGDGTTDDTAAIQSAIDACSTAGGGTVWFPKGTYKLVTNPLKLYSGTTPTIVAYSNITLAGAGSSSINGTIITQTTTGVDVIKGLNDTANGAQALNNTIKNICVAWGTATLTNSGNGIYLAQQAAGGPSFQQWNFENVVASNFQGSGKYGFNIESMITSTMDTCQAVACANGFYLNGASGGAFNSVSTSVNFISCYANMATNGVNGFNCLDNTYINFLGCAVDIGANSTGVAYLIDGSSAVTFNSCGCELDGTHTLSNMWKITNGSSGVALNACYAFQSKTAIDVYVTGTSVGVVLVGFNDNSSVSGSTGLKVDAASSATEIDSNWGAVATKRTLAAGAFNMILSDSAGNMTVPVAAIFNGSTSGTTTLKSGAAAGSSVITLPVATDTLVGKATTDTLTNKRVTKRVVTTTQSATPTINTNNTDVASITGLAQAITSFTTNLSGTAVDGDTLIIRITDNGTARAITWGASFEASTVALPTTTVISTMLTVGFIWNTATSKWRCVAVA